MGVLLWFFSVCYWIEKAKDKCESSVAIPSKECVRLQFLPTTPRNKVSKYFTGRLNIIKKAQIKHVQHNNPYVKHGNINSKNMRKVIENSHNKDKMLLISCYYKCAVKAGLHCNPLALVPKIKPGWIATSVKLKAVNHGTFIKSNVVPCTMFIIDISNYCNLEKFHKG